jgi:murein DD-endopeptidase MepM/ murein hydrolase activator NlpD
MALNLADRLLTIVVTATVTSAAWLVAGSTSFRETGESAASTQEERSEAPQPAPSLPPVLAPPAGAVEDLTIPVAGVTAAQLTDTFSDERDRTRLHEALDIMAPAGTPVVAAARGKVERLFRSDAGGNTVYVRSQDRRTIHYYAHLQDYAAGLKEGQSVERGQRLGSVGSSGNANPAAPHLHYAIMRTTPDAEWWEPATAVNPYALLRGN